MAIYARRPESTFEPCPEGLHQAVCVDVIDHGTQTTRWGPKSQVTLVWQIDLSDKRGRRYQVRKRYTNSLHPKAQLLRDLEGWRSRKFTEAELERFDLEALLGTNCQLQVIHHAAEDGTVFANVQTIVPIPRSTAKIAPDQYTRAKDRVKSQPPAEAETQDDAGPDIPF